MQLFDFLKALLPSIDRSTVDEDLRITSSELDQVVIPSYRVAAEHFRSNKPKSKAVKDISDVFTRQYRAPGAKRSTIVEEISIKLDNVKANTVYIAEQIDELFERQIIREGLTAKKMSLMRAASSLSYISRYSTDLLNYIYIAETAELGQDVSESMRLSPAQTRHVESNIAKFAHMLSDFGVPNDVLTKVILAIPEAELSARGSSALGSVYKESELDPFAGPYMSGFIGNPIYHVRLVVAEWQASRYKANRDKKEMLQLRLMHLKMKQSGRDDPKVEQEIEYLQGRIDRITRYLQEVESSVEGD